MTVSSCREPFFGCLNHLISGEGYAIAEQVKVALSRALTSTLVFAGPCTICTATTEKTICHTDSSAYKSIDICTWTQHSSLLVASALS